MIAIERGKLIPVSGDNDSPDLQNAIDVQFNPVTLKVSLSNTLKENARNGNSRSAQFVDKSSSNLTIELIFDTTYIESAASDTRNAIEQGSDVRLQTKKIADTFIKPVAEGDKLKAPKRCLFQWGAFEFLGLVQSFDETLDFFSPEGRPLRATVSLKLSEDRYQFRNRDVQQAERDTPSLSSTGGGSGDQNAAPVPGGSGAGAGNWRDTSLFNGIETPRMPSLSAVAVPSLSLGASLGLGVSGGIGLGISGGLNVGAGVNLTLSASLGVNVGGSVASGGGSVATGGGVAKSIQQPVTPVSPAFKFGNSASLGTGIEGAFSPTGPAGSLNAASLQTGSVPLRTAAMSAGAVGPITSNAATGRPLSTVASQAVTQSPGRKSTGVSVAGLLKAAADSGVGFD